MPAYNAAKTLKTTYEEILAQDIVDDIILVDDGSRDDTVAVHVHDHNRGYGGNQKTCYRLALEKGADIIIMVHPDYQYTPKLIPALVCIIANNLHEFVIGSRILGGYALKGGMPWWKYISNRFLTGMQNLLQGAKLSEYHTGYRAYSRHLIESMDFSKMSDDFLFDNQFIAQALWRKYTVGEVSGGAPSTEWVASGSAGSIAGRNLRIANPPSWGAPSQQLFDFNDESRDRKNADALPVDLIGYLYSLPSGRAASLR
jgi:glycosyltransferase involved in cell wall biosynthesis